MAAERKSWVVHFLIKGLTPRIMIKLQYTDLEGSNYYTQIRPKLNKLTLFYATLRFQKWRSSYVFFKGSLLLILEKF